MTGGTTAAPLGAPAPGPEPARSSEIGWRLGDIKHPKGLSDTGRGLGRNLIVALDDPQQPMIYLEALTL